KCWVRCEVDSASRDLVRDVRWQSGAGDQREHFGVVKRLMLRTRTARGCEKKQREGKDRPAPEPIGYAEQGALQLRRWDSSDELLAGKTLKIGHLALHLLAGGVSRRANTLNAQPELIGVGGAHERFFEGDQLFAVKVEE